MKSIHPTRPTALLLALMLCTGTTAALAATLPAEQHNSGIAYTTGGIGAEQATAFKEAMNRYPLAIELVQKEKSGKRDEFIADAQVRITDHAGKEVFNAKADGPFMLVKLEPGKYSMTASYETHTLHRNDFTVASGRTTHETFVFPADHQ